MTALELITLKDLYKEEVNEHKRLFNLYNSDEIKTNFGRNIALNKYTESVNRLEMFNLILETLNVNYDEWNEVIK